MPRIRRQAANLRYIIEAPKLELRPEERVKIPELKEVERKKCAPSAAPAIQALRLFWVLS